VPHLGVPAEIFGIPDRGRLPWLGRGHHHLTPHHRLPRGRDRPRHARRRPALIARASGIRWSFVNGQPIIRDGRLPEPQAVSGAGRVIRAA
jgi:hypothetical protein